jgi:mono/diheme cytochrome c family protein
MRSELENVFTRPIAMLMAFLVASSLAIAFFAVIGRSSQKLPDGDALFLKNCASCHGKDGRAKTFKARFNHARNLTDPTWQAAINDEHMYESILRGKGKMPAFRKKLSDNEVAALVTYVRTLKR